jgi:hypothetical protein
MATKRRPPVKSITNSECDKCSHEYLSIDYDKAVSMIENLSSYKLAYQKMYITMFISIATITMALLQLPTSTASDKLLNDVGVFNFIGFLIFGSAAFGFVIIKNLASTRISEIFFCSSIAAIRSVYINKTDFPEDYPRLKKVDVLERSSADYHMILVCSILNGMLFSCGTTLIIYTKLSLVSTMIGAFFVFIIYGFAHYFLIEKYMKMGSQKFSINSQQTNA